MGDYAPWAELQSAKPRASDRVGADVARDELSRSSFRRRVRHYQRETREDLGYAFLIFREADDQLLGRSQLSNVRRGVTQAALLGYWLGLPLVGRGYMTEAVGAACYRSPSRRSVCTGWRRRPCRTTLPRSRVLEAQRLPARGHGARLLKINGMWQDHDLFALLHDDRAGSSDAEVRSA